MVFKLQEPAITAFSRMLVAEHGYIVAREVVDEFGDIQDWRNVTGTGPYQLTDVVEGSSWTYTKIDDYWGFDPKFPDNRLPYADTIEFLVVNDPTAITSLMRSGQADWIGFGLNSHLTSVDSAVNLQKTKTRPGAAPRMPTGRRPRSNSTTRRSPGTTSACARPSAWPSTHESIAENYMQGWGDASPQGATGAKCARVCRPVRGVARGNPAVLSV